MLLFFQENCFLRKVTLFKWKAYITQKGNVSELWNRVKKLENNCS